MPKPRQSQGVFFETPCKADGFVQVRLGSILRLHIAINGQGREGQPGASAHHREPRPMGHGVLFGRRGQPGLGVVRLRGGQATR